jgi:hypothetical protein
MIKIQMDNPAQKKQEYLDAIIDKVAFRVSVLKKSLSHLSGSPIDFNTINYQSIGPITKNIIKIIGDGNKEFTSGNDYSAQISHYLLNPNRLGNINIAGLIQFCNDIQANNNQMLSELLIWEAADLMNQNEKILNHYGLNTPENIDIIKLAFDYKRYNEDISSPIRAYFREKEFVKFCPYCNTKAAYHNVNAGGEVVDSYELDHFYDKARYPLLSYCLFNLVPSDHTCNVTNKAGTKFTDEYHINPHLSGYTNSIKFIPIGMNLASKVDKIELSISEAQGSALYKKINGNKLTTLEEGVLGNLNVFKIWSKHKDETHRAKTIIKTLKANNSNLSHVKKYLQLLNGLNIKDSYKKWYENELNVRFNPSNFNDKAYSKFSRDIHDHYYTNSKTGMNKYIIELMNED